LFQLAALCFNKQFKLIIMADYDNGIPAPNAGDNMLPPPRSGEEILTNAHKVSENETTSKYQITQSLTLMSSLLCAKWMLAASFYLTPQQLRKLVFFADSMGMTCWHFWCLPWDAFGSKRNDDARYPLSHRLPIRTDDNKETFDKWKAICYFLPTNLEIWGAFSEMFHWNNCEFMFRVTGTFIDLCALSRRDLEKTAQEKLTNQHAIKIPIERPNDKDMCAAKLDAWTNKFNTPEPYPKRHNRVPLIDMGTDGHKNMDYRACESPDPDDITEVDSPPSKNPALYNKVMCKPRIKSPLFVSPGTRKAQKCGVKPPGLGAIINAAKADIEEVCGPPCPLVDTDSECDSNGPIFASPPLKKTLPSVKKMAAADEATPSSAISASVGTISASTKSSGTEEGSFAGFGSAQKPVMFEDTPPKPVETFWQKRARLFKPVGKNKTTSAAEKKAKTKGPKTFKKLGKGPAKGPTMLKKIAPKIATKNVESTPVKFPPRSPVKTQTTPRSPAKTQTTENPPSQDDDSTASSHPNLTQNGSFICD